MINIDFTPPWVKGNEGLLGIAIVDSLLLINEEEEVLEADMFSIGILLFRLNIIFNIREKQEENGN